MANVTNELIYEVLKKVQADVSGMKETLSEHGHQLAQVRLDFHGLRGEFLRQDATVSGHELRPERIETRLGLRDA